MSTPQTKVIVFYDSISKIVEAQKDDELTEKTNAARCVIEDLFDLLAACESYLDLRESWNKYKNETQVDQSNLNSVVEFMQNATMASARENAIADDIKKILDFLYERTNENQPAQKTEE